MKRYFVLLSTRTNLSFVPEEAIYSFNIADLVISFRRFKDPRDRILSEHKYGWMIEVKLEGENIDNAIIQASKMSEFFLSAFCFDTGCEIYPSNIILAYEITENVEKRVFKQYFRNLIFPSSTQITFSSFSEHSERIWSLKKEHSDRIYRAIRWFRKGIIGDDPLDQFLFFWHGLEALNSPLAEHFGCEKSIEKKIERKCKVCGQKYLDTITGRGGIEALFDDNEINDTIRFKINTMRNGISHGFANITELYDIAIELLPTMAKILHDGIAKILDVSFEEPLFKNLDRVAPIKVGDFNYIEGFFNEKDILKLGLEGYYPFFIQEGIPVKTEKGYNVQSKYKPQINCSYTLYAIGVSGKNTSLEIKMFN